MQLKVKLSRAADLKSRLERKQNLTKYIPTVSKSLIRVLQKAELHDVVNAAPTIAESDGHQATLPTKELVANLLERVTGNQITIKEINSKLTERVEQDDAEQALDYVSEANRRRQKYDVWLPILSPPDAAMSCDLDDQTSILLYPSLRQ